MAFTPSNPLYAHLLHTCGGWSEAAELVNAINNAGGTNVLSPGVVLPYAGTAAPTGFLACDGSAVSRTTFSALFAAVATTWGSGDGSTTFNVPDFRDRSLIGTSPGSLSGNRPTARSLGQTLGEETHTLILSEAPAHTHSCGGGNFIGDVQNNQEFVSTGGDTGTTVANTDVQGGGGAHNNMQPSAVIQWIIKT